MIKEWISGSTARATPASFRQLGGYARRVAACVATPDPLLFRDIRDGWHGQVGYNIAELRPDDPLIARGVYPIEEQHLVRSAFEALARDTFSVAVQHGDLSPRNLIVGERRAPVLIDWGCGSVDVYPIQPINNLRLAQCEPGAASDACFNAFIEGMGLSWQECEAMLPTLNRWLVLKAFDSSVPGLRRAALPFALVLSGPSEARASRTRRPSAAHRAVRLKCS